MGMRRMITSVVMAVVSLSVSFVAFGTARAGSVDLSTSNNYGDNAPSYNTVTETFNLPTGFTDAVLNISLFQADDRAILELNNTIVSDTGIFGPGLGSFFYTNGGQVVSLRWRPPGIDFDI